MIDLNSAPEQQNRASGPIPAGSSVLVRLTIRKPKYDAPGMDMVGITQSGLFFLDAEYEVMAGTYAGLKLWENLFLPTAHQDQHTKMTDGQVKACNIAWAKIRALVESARGIDPKDMTPQAKRKRDISSWLDLSGMEFPVIVGIKNEPSTGNNGRVYWNNSISRIIPSTAKEHHLIMNGGEIITDGPTSGSGEKRKSGGGNDLWNDSGFESPPASAYDDPF